jgi:hypothetical protein
VHYDDYGVFKSPLRDFCVAVRRRGLEGLVTYVDRGDTVELRQRHEAESSSTAPDQ